MKFNLTLKQLLSTVSFLASLVIGFIALFIPPPGIIDASVLWYTAQLLCFTAALLGVNFNIDFLNKRINDNSDKK